MRARLPDLAAVDEAIARARELTARRLAAKPKRSPAYWRRVANRKPRRPWVPRSERRPLDQWKRDERDARRDRMAERPVEASWSESTAAYFDELYAKAETRAAAECRYAGIRELVAAKLDQVHEWARAHELPEPEHFQRCAGLLRRARRAGHWGIDLDSGELVMRFRDRSGLAILDPSEARERQAELARRLVPELMAAQRAGLRVYYAVASEPNVPAGRLAWGKAHLFDRFRRVILGRDRDGKRIHDAFPEIVGAFAVQEDPLSADGQTWNVHLNLILVVDPRACTRLPDDLVQQSELHLGGTIAKLPERRARDRTPDGCLSYSKLHFAWCSDQFYARPIEARDEATLGRALLEVVKYSAKWVSKKQLDELAGGAPSLLPELVDEAPALELAGGRTRGRGRPAARGVTEWPHARVAEWITANRRFRRVRGWGGLYRIAKEERPPDQDAAGRIRWLGQVRVEATGVVVFAARLAWSKVSSTHGDKSGAIFERSTGPGARAGPIHDQGALA